MKVQIVASKLNCFRASLTYVTNQIKPNSFESIQWNCKTDCDWDVYIYRKFFRFSVQWLLPIYCTSLQDCEYIPQMEALMKSYNLVTSHRLGVSQLMPFSFWTKYGLLEHPSTFGNCCTSLHFSSYGHNSWRPNFSKKMHHLWDLLASEIWNVSICTFYLHIYRKKVEVVSSSVLTWDRYLDRVQSSYSLSELCYSRDELKWSDS